MTISSKGPQCWECQRRDSPCDGKTPICGNCSSAGMVCPGFTNNRPLTWLRTGMISRIPKKGKPARPSATATATASGRDSRRRSIASSSTAGTASPQAKASTPPRSRIRKTAASKSDRGSDAGTPSGASSSGCSSGDSPPDLSANPTTTVVNKAVQSRNGDEDDDGASSQSSGYPRHQLVACRNRSGNSPADGATQIHVTAIPPDLRPQDWDYIDAIKMCKFDSPMLQISTLQISTLSRPSRLQLVAYLVYAQPCADRPKHTHLQFVALQV